MDSPLILVVSAAIAAILHTLVPDHEIPLAMIGRTQDWTVKKMAGVTLIAGVIHISVSMGIGVLALLASVALAQYVAETVQQVSGFMLIVFGLVYALISWRRKYSGHSHSHGSEHDVHSLEPSISLGAWIIAVVGIAPCFTLIPVLVAAVPYGLNTTFLVMLSYAFATIGMMVILTSIALKSIQYVTRLEKIERHLEILAGFVISTVGVWLILEIAFGL